MQKSDISGDDLKSIVISQLRELCSKNNSTFIDIIDNTYKLILCSEPGITPGDAKNTCIDYVTLKYLFIQNKLDIVHQLQFINDIIQALNDDVDNITNINAPLAIDIKSYIVRTCDITNIVTSLVDTIELDDANYTKLQDILEDNDDTAEEIANIANSALSNKDIPLPFGIIRILQALDIDIQDESIFDDACTGVQVNQAVTNNKIDLNNFDYKYDLDQIAQLPGAKRLVVNGQTKVDISNVDFTTFLKKYRPEYLALAIEIIAPSLFYSLNTYTKSPLEQKEVYTKIFQNIAKDLKSKQFNKPQDEQSAVEDAFFKLNMSGSELLKLLINENKETAHSNLIRVFKRLLFALNNLSSELINVADNAKIIDQFKKKIQRNGDDGWNKYYIDTVDTLLHDFDNNEDIIELYQTVTAAKKKPEKEPKPKKNPDKAKKDSSQKSDKGSSKKDTKTDAKKDSQKSSENVSSENDPSEDDTSTVNTSDINVYDKDTSKMDISDNTSIEYSIDISKEQNRLSGNIGAANIAVLFDVSSDMFIKRFIKNIIKELFKLNSNLRQQLLENIIYNTISLFKQINSDALENFSRKQLMDSINIQAGSILQILLRINAKVITGRLLKNLIPTLNLKFGRQFRVTENTTGKNILINSLFMYLDTNADNYRDIISELFNKFIEKIDIMKMYHNILKRDTIDNYVDIDVPVFNTLPKSEQIDEDDLPEDELDESTNTDVTDESIQNASDKNKSKQDISKKDTMQEEDKLKQDLSDEDSSKNDFSKADAPVQNKSDEEDTPTIDTHESDQNESEQSESNKSSSDKDSLSEDVLDKSNKNKSNDHVQDESLAKKDISDITFDKILGQVETSYLPAIYSQFFYNCFDFKNKTIIIPFIEQTSTLAIQQALQKNIAINESNVIKIFKSLHAYEYWDIICKQNLPIEYYMMLVDDLYALDHQHRNYMLQKNSTLVKSINQYIHNHAGVLSEYIKKCVAKIVENCNVADIFMRILNASSLYKLRKIDIQQDDKIKRKRRLKYKKSPRTQKQQNTEENNINPETVSADNIIPDDESVINDEQDNKSIPKNTDKNEYICDQLSLKEFLNIINTKYKVSAEQLMTQLVDLAISAIDSANIINKDNLNQPVATLINLSKNKQLLSYIIKYLFNTYSDITFSLTNTNTKFAQEIAKRIQQNKSFSNYLRNSINNLNDKYRTKSRLKRNNPSKNDSPKNDVSENDTPKQEEIKNNDINQNNSNRDLSLQETKRLKTVDQAMEYNDHIKDTVLFNMSDFFTHEKIIVTRYDIITGEAGFDYPAILKAYLEANPDRSMPATFATGIVANNCIFLTSYGKLDKNEVLNVIKNQYPYKKVYFKEGSRNFTLITERLAKKISLNHFKLF